LKKILLAEPIDPAGMKFLEGKAEVVVSPDPSGQSVAKLLKDAHGLIVRTATKVTRSMIEGAPLLEVISRTGGGLDNVDIQAATDCGVVVCGVKGPQDRFVAEHAVTLMMALAKQILYLNREVRRGNFRSRYEYRPMGLAGKRVGLIGLGRIGRIVADLCHHLGMEVWGYDPYLRPEDLHLPALVLTEDREKMITGADFLSVHVPLSDETQGLIGRKELGWMKSTAFFINTSRGEIVDESALIEALQQGKIAGAGLDVFAQEPPQSTHLFFQMENVILTPHSGALTRDAVAQLAEGAARNVIEILEGRQPSFSANWEEVVRNKAPA
jgi:D-3-phosphoglycerate dehydrogenase / 2-oxoglutarate reductase